MKISGSILVLTFISFQLVPLLFFTSLGMFGAFGYLARLALKGPDVRYKWN